jgi:hypothetical protein
VVWISITGDPEICEELPNPALVPDWFSGKESAQVLERILTGFLPEENRNFFIIFLH